MTNRMKPLSPEAEARLSDDDRKWLPVVRTHHPVNLRVLEGVDLAKLKTQKREGRNLPPLYVNP